MQHHITVYTAPKEVDRCSILSLCIPPLKESMGASARSLYTVSKRTGATSYPCLQSVKGSSPPCTLLEGSTCQPVTAQNDQTNRPNTPRLGEADQTPTPPHTHTHSSKTVYKSDEDSPLRSTPAAGANFRPTNAPFCVAISSPFYSRQA